MYRIEIDELPPTLNKFYSSPKWYYRHKQAEYWHERFHWAFKEVKLQKPLNWPITLSITQYAKRVPKDVDNTIMGAKFASDALVKGGWLPDDSPKYINKIILGSEKAKKDKIVILIQ